MATTFYFRKTLWSSLDPGFDPNSSGGGSDDEMLITPTRGAGAQSLVTNVAASDPIGPLLTNGAGGNIVTFYTKPLDAVTISGNVTMNLRGLESAMTVNVASSVVIYQMQNNGQDYSPSRPVINLADATEAGTTESAHNFTAAPTSRTLVAGDRLVFFIRWIPVGTTGAGTATFFLDGPTAAASGDSFITFTETIRELASLPFKRKDGLYRPSRDNDPWSSNGGWL